MTRNAALQGGVAGLLSGSNFQATASAFLENNAAVAGGVAHLDTSSQFSARNSSFVANRALGGANGGDVASLAGSSTVELYNASLPVHASLLRCEGAGTVYAALIDMNLTEGLFTLGGSCIVFFYQSNGDGTQEYAQELRDKGVFQGGVVNLVQWQHNSRQRPCLHRFCRRRVGPWGNQSTRLVHNPHVIDVATLIFESAQELSVRAGPLFRRRH